MDVFGKNVLAKYPNSIAPDGRPMSQLDPSEVASLYIKDHPEYASYVDTSAYDQQQEQKQQAAQTAQNDATIASAMPATSVMAAPKTGVAPQQPFTDPLHKLDPTGSSSKEMLTESLPTAGAVAGGALGGLAGGLAASPTIFGIPAGVIAGATAGSAAGGAAGEAAREKIKEGSINLPAVGKTALDYGALELVGGPLFSLAGKSIKAVGSMVGKAFIPKNMQEAMMLQSYKAGTSFLQRVGVALELGSKEAPTTAGSAAFDKGLAGTQTMIGVQAKRASNKIWNTLIQPAINQADASGVKVDMQKFFTQLEQKIAKDNPELSRQKSLLKALDALKEDYSGVAEIPLSKLQKFKEGWAEFVPQKAYRGENIEGSFKEVQDDAAGLARQVIYNSLGQDVRQAYLDYGNLRSLQKLGQVAMTGSKLKGGSFTGLHALFDMATIPVSTVGGQTIYKVGQGFEVVGANGSRTLRDALGIPFFGNESESQSEPSQQQPTEATGDQGQ